MRKTTPHHARGKLQAARPGDKVETKGPNAKHLFEKKPKSSEPDNVGRKMRPVAHAPVAAAKAKKREHLVKRLSNKVI